MPARLALVLPVIPYVGTARVTARRFGTPRVKVSCLAASFEVAGHLLFLRPFGSQLWKASNDLPSQLLLFARWLKPCWLKWWLKRLLINKLKLS
jgi:hypothetical protein